MTFSFKYLMSDTWVHVDLLTAGCAPFTCCSVSSLFLQRIQECWPKAAANTRGAPCIRVGAAALN